MMKSGEFSAGGRRDHDGIVDDDGFDQNGRPLYPLNQHDYYQNPRSFENHQNYGNPNFIPPP
jgi:hypothetical protein